MKKILFILFFVPFAALGEEFEINITSITGSDTTIYLEARKADLVTFDFTTFNANNATLDVGQTDRRVSFVTSSITGNPFTLSKVTYTKTANGYTRNWLAVEPACIGWNGVYIAFKLTKGSVTAGVLKVFY